MAIYNYLKSQTSQPSSDVSISEALTSKVYRRATWNSQALAAFDQLTGVSGVVLFSTNILLEMQQQGKFDIPISWAIQAVGFFNLAFSFLGQYPMKKFGQRTTLLAGQYTMVACLFGIVVFSIQEMSSMILVSITVFILAFQTSLGPIFFIHS